MFLENLSDAFYDELRDVLSAERQLVSALPELGWNATDPKLKQALEDHHRQTVEHVKRVEEAFEETGETARAKTCEAMKGLLTEAEEMLAENGESSVKDALIIACAQKVEHYEIATYGTLCTWAEILGYKKALKLLKQNIADEEAADKHLTSIAKTVNDQAAV